MTEVEQPPLNGVDLSAAEDDENSKARPADIEQDMREMERRKRVEAIMGSKLFREELERIVDCARESGNAAGILQQLSDIVGVPSSRIGSVFKTSTSMLPINDIRGVESMGYAKGEKILRCKLAATFRLLDLFGWSQGLGAQITARLKVDQEYFLVNPYGLLHHEITASSLNKVDMQGNIVEQGTTNFGVNKSHFVLHSVVHAARPDIRCAIYIGCTPVVAISSLKTSLLPLTKDACVLGELSTYSYLGFLNDEEERNKLVRSLGPNSKILLLTNHGALCCGETIEEAYFAACHIVQACETQLKLLPIGLDNLVLISEESRKIIFDQSRRPPEELEKKFAAITIIDTNKSEEDKNGDVNNTTKIVGQSPKWRVGGAEFEALMRMLDNAGYRTGYIYRHPLIKSEPPRPKNDVELPPAVSSLGYLLEEEELFRQGIWKKGDLRKGGDRSRWLNSPNVYQKVEVLETGTPDPKKITKWVAEGSPTHSTPVRIDDPLQFVPVNTNPKEFKRVQQQIKDNRRADKISAGPQSHILEGVTWDEANRIKDATVSSAGDHVVLMGAASKGIIQRGFQHNATVYKAPYAKNPFDNVTDDELNEYKRTVERKKKSIHGEYTDTDFSESEALSSLQTSAAQQTKQNTTKTTTTAAASQSEPEDISEHQVMRIQTEQAPVPSQPEVVLSDDFEFLSNNNQAPQDQDPKIHPSFSLWSYTNKKLQSSAQYDEEEFIYTPGFQKNENIVKNDNAKILDQPEQTEILKNKIETLFHTYSHTYTFPQQYWYGNQGSGNISNKVFKFCTSYAPQNAFRTDNAGFSPNNENLYSKTKYLELLRKNFKICCTPNKCNQLFVSLIKSKSSKEKSTLGDKVLNSKVSLHLCGESLKKKSDNPYRTVSHFGFNNPLRYPNPEHKHIAVKTEKGQKYVPLRRSVSYEEIFSSQRYLNLCENCFEFIVRLKPQLIKYETKLHNLIDQKELRIPAKNVCVLNENDNLSKSVTSSEPYSVFSLQLSNSENKIGINDDPHTSIVLSPTFHDRFTHINRYQLSTDESDYINSLYPASFLKIKYDIEGFDSSIDFSEKNQNSIYGNDTNSSISLTGKHEQNFLCTNTIHNLTSIDNNNSIKNKEIVRNSKESSKKLMNRQERSRRKLEFHELWEDHVNFAESIETVNNMTENKVADEEVLNQQTSDSDFSFEKNDVEEFNSTLSRISSHTLGSHNFAKEQTEKIKLLPTTTNDYLQLKELNHQLSQPINRLKDSLDVVRMSDYGKNNTFNQNNDEGNKITKKFSTLEQTILDKIYTNNLNKSDKIFGKIEYTILNKMTPFQIELKIKECAKVFNDKSNIDEKENCVCKALSLASKSSRQKSLRRPTSLSPTPLNPLTKKPSNLIASQQQRGTEEFNRQALLLTAPYLKKPIAKKEKMCRNFILENILNASVPRLSRQIIQRQFKADKKFEANQTFGLSGVAQDIQKSSNNSEGRESIVTPHKSSSTAFYSFQSKVVGGFPRIWISMPKNSRRKKIKSSTSSLIQVASSAKKRSAGQKNITLSPIVTDTNSVTNVDAEIYALGDEIQQLQPRLENYKRKLDDFGNRVAKCISNINECVNTQENILSVQNQIKDGMKQQAYSEKVMCRVQTFSLSEAED